MSLVSLSTFKEYLPEVQGSGSDTELQNLLDRVESAVASYIGFPKPIASGDATAGPALADQSYTLYIDQPDFDFPFILSLPIRPLISVTSWHSDIDRVYGSDSLVASSEYELDTTLGRIVLKESATTTIERGYRANKVVCTAGFTSAPSDLEHAVCAYAAHLNRAKQTQGKQSTTQRDVTVNLSPRTIPPEVKEILYNYRTFRRIL